MWTPRLENDVRREELKLSNAAEKHLREDRKDLKFVKSEDIDKSHYSVVMEMEDKLE